ncbi:helix-turn-helix domain-containing protein [Kitasatospora sp. NPDC004531]
MRINKLDLASGPLAAFGFKVRELRKAAKLTQDELAARANCTGTYVSMIENGRRLPPVNFVRTMDRALDADGALEGAWYLLGSTSLLEGFREYMVLEARARLIRIFKTGLVHGLFQTREYAEEVEAGYVGRGSITAEQAEERVNVMMARQAVLDQSAGPRLQVVLDEGCLHSVMGNAQIMVRQLDHLLALADHPRVVLQVMPFTSGSLRPFSHPLTLLTLSDNQLAAYTETPERGYLTRNLAPINDWHTDYDLLQANALSQADTVAAMRKIRRGFQNGGAHPQHRAPSRRRMAQVELQRWRRRLR